MNRRLAFDPEQERGPSTMSNLDELLGKLLGRHHREVVVSREHCVACNQFSPTFDEVRTAARRAEALEARLTEPEPQSVQRCVTHHACDCHAWYSDGYQKARATLAGEGAPR